MNPSQARAAQPQGNSLQLTLATGAFAVCFAMFGSVSAMMPVLKSRLSLSPVQVSVALALPVLLGSLGRIPLGMLTDRYGGRRVFTLVMLGSILPVVALGWVQTYGQLLVAAFGVGLALASFSVGAGFVSGWFPPQRQGFALGVYGAGNIGQSLAAFGAPLIVAGMGYRWGFWVFALLTAIWVVVYGLFARNAPRQGPPKSLKQILQPLSNRMSWVLSLYYFLTFGGFVAMAVYLPTLLTDLFALTPKDAGFRTAGFVLLATLMRPIGGTLADKVGGQRILAWVFPFTGLMAVLLSFTQIVPFTIGALGMAAAIGLGNGAVFKLVPEFFPQSVGIVTGLVGAAGGLGGFFPPLLLGLIRQTTGTFVLGFIALGVFAVVCWFVTRRVRPQPVAQPSMP
jgi:NNP family nitrate/nitrite transporter-like MFS transporter